MEGKERKGEWRFGLFVVWFGKERNGRELKEINCLIRFIVVWFDLILNEGNENTADFWGL